MKNGKISFWKKSTGNRKPWKLFYSIKANGKAKRRNSRYLMGLYEFKSSKTMEATLRKMLECWNSNPVFVTKESRYRLRDYSNRVRAERRESHEAFIDKYEDREGFVSNFTSGNRKKRAKKTKKSKGANILDISELTDSQKRKLYAKLSKAFSKKTKDEDTFEYEEESTYSFE